MSNIILFAIPFFLITMIVEAWICSREKVIGYKNKDTFASLSMGIGNVLVQNAWKGVVVGVAAFLYQYTWFELPQAWWTWVAVIIAHDFLYYWFHRFSHEIRLFWAAHVNHHSSEHYNLSTALRQSWTTPFTSMFFYWPLPLLGVHPAMILVADAISLLYQYWIHTELIGRMGPFESIMNTPSHHRVHHGANVQYLDRNYAGIFIIWDKLFDTFEPEKEPVCYGLTKNITSFNPIIVAFHEWVAMLKDAWQANTWHERWLYLYQPPGWSPDGSTLTARQMKKHSQLLTNSN